jgi:uncharacterized Zn-finger protein
MKNSVSKGYSPNVITISTTKAHCQGEGERHPAIFLDLSKTGHAVCPYCSQVFESTRGHSDKG